MIEVNQSTQLQVIDAYFQKDTISEASHSLNMKLKSTYDTKLLDIMIKTGNTINLINLCLSSIHSQHIIVLDQRYMKGVQKLCKSTVKKVYFTDISLTSEQFKSIFEYCCKVKILMFMRCKIDEIPKDFAFDSNLKYEIKRFEPRKAIGSKGLFKIAKAISNNKNLRKSLSHIVVNRSIQGIVCQKLEKVGLKVVIDQFSK